MKTPQTFEEKYNIQNFFGKAAFKPHIPKGCERYASAVEWTSVEVKMTAAQRLEIEKMALRFRCSSAEMILALALQCLESSDGFKDPENETALLGALLRYVDGKVAPRAIVGHLPACIAPARTAKERASAFRLTHAASSKELNAMSSESA